MELNKASFSGIRVLIIGDIMIDQYMWGKVYRNSPEADIPVLEDVRIEQKLGGAGNVANNVKNLGAEVFLLSLVGSDSASAQVSSLLESSRITHRLVQDDTRPTTVKTRVFRDSEQLIRVDQESTNPMNSLVDQHFMTAYEEILHSYEPQIIILQDYNKGVLTPHNIPLIISAARKKSVYISVDPKKENFLLYKHVNLIKPNLSELYYQIDADQNNKQFDQKKIAKASIGLLTKMSVDRFLVTLSEHGAMICEETGSYYQQADSIEVVDVCGAGDGVVAIATLMDFNGFKKEQILEYTNKTGKIVCQKTGVAGITIDELLE